MAAIKETQPDKLEKIKRFEKEKKAMQKKQEGATSRNIAKTAAKNGSKQKRNNKNWTKVYEDDLVDEYDLDYNM
ncbi:hypothetical protein EDC18_10110 [Natranaerovirga pectinivora]|uniref:Uncharacterized protein n=1 Tax=Natranaerovirga pectinivora TaxID=682400 RepID=A0A4R3MN92_9FIRM|nr:hypothetical protein [Natranaerovirga pectinivora]TCT16715.1 hypothetical protein EDC18_10110 [Natranaerovirga pectinivora]